MVRHYRAFEYRECWRFIITATWCLLLAQRHINGNYVKFSALSLALVVDLATSQYQKRPVSVVIFGILINVVRLSCWQYLLITSHIGLLNLPRLPNVVRSELKIVSMFLAYPYLVAVFIYCISVAAYVGWSLR